MKIYRIKAYNGLFSTGGYYPLFKERGKIWTGIGAVKNHIRNIMYLTKYGKEFRHEEMGKWASWNRTAIENFLTRIYPAGTVVQEYELGKEGVAETPIVDFFNSFFYKKSR